MNPTEAALLLRMVKALCPSQQVDTYTPDAWAMVLDDVRAADATEAVRILAKRDLEPGQARYIEPGHIRAEVRRIRERRIADAPAYEPPPGLDTTGYLRWLTDAREAIADGRIPEHAGELAARPLDLPQLRGMAEL